MRKHEEQEFRLDPLYIKQQLKISNAKLSQNKNTQFKDLRSMSDLLKVLTDKNEKIKKQKVQKKLNQKPDCFFTFNDERLIKEYTDKEMAALDIPFPQQNLLAPYQSLKNISSNTFELFQIHKKIKILAKDSQFLFKKKDEKVIKPVIKPVNKIQKVKIKKENEQKQEQIQLLMNNLSFSGEQKRIKKMATKQIVDKTMIKTETVGDINNEINTEISKRMDQRIQNRLNKNKQLRQLRQLGDELLKITRQYKGIHRQTLISYVFDILINKLAKSKQQDGSIIDVQHREIINNYHFMYINRQNKIFGYSSIRAKNVNDNKSLLQLQNILRHQSLVYWCGCLMIFLSCEIGRDRLNEQLNRCESRQLGQQLIKVIKKFDSNKIQQSYQNNYLKLKQRIQYQHNIFYRVLIKIIYNKQLQSSQLIILKEQQHKILIYLKLKYNSFYDIQYKKSKQFNNYKQLLQNKLKQNIINKNTLSIKSSIQRFIQLQLIDQLFSNIIYYQSCTFINSPLQALLFINIIFDHQQLLQYSQYHPKQWAQISLILLSQITPHINHSNSQLYLNIIIQMLLKIQTYLTHQQITNHFIHLLHINKILISSYTYISLIINKLNIQYQTIQNIIIQYVSIDNNYQQQIFKYLSLYIKLSNKSFSQKHSINLKNSFQLFQTQKINNLHQEKDTILTFQEIQNQNISELKIKNSFFITGLKLIAKYLLRIYTHQIKSIYFQHQFKYITNKIKTFISRLQTISNILIPNKQSIQSNLQSLHSYHEKIQKIQQVHNFITQINSLIDICQFQMTFIYLSKYIRKQSDQQLLQNIMHGFQKFSDKQIGMKNKLIKICKNMKYFEITDKNRGFQILLQNIQKTLELINRTDSTKSRKTNPSLRSINYSFITQFIKCSLPLIQVQTQKDNQLNFERNKQKFKQIARML